MPLSLGQGNVRRLSYGCVLCFSARVLSTQHLGGATRCYFLRWRSKRTSWLVSVLREPSFSIPSPRPPPPSALLPFTIHSISFVIVDRCHRLRFLSRAGPPGGFAFGPRGKNGSEGRAFTPFLWSSSWFSVLGGRLSVCRFYLQSARLLPDALEQAAAPGVVWHKLRSRR